MVAVPPILDLFSAADASFMLAIYVGTKTYF
jgi:hypothetical protein